MGGFERDTKKIAKNTMALYISMAITMLIALYSSRLILKHLGVDDFGLYNVVGGVAALLSFMKTSLTTSTQRFLSFEMARGDKEQLKRLFSMNVTSHFIICGIIVLLAETIGLWFLNSHIKMDIERIEAANWIYQFSILSLCFSTLSIPYTADVISHEKMGFYAFVTSFAAILKLFAAVTLAFVSADKLIVFGFFICLVEFVSLVLFWAYSKRTFCEATYIAFFEKEMFKKIMSFSGWTILGQISVVGANNGTSILVNIYHTVAANAAMGIAQQVNNAITGLTANFQTAFQPQITKSYAAQDYEFYNNIVRKASKISYFMLFIVSLPVIINIDWLLELWLDEVPKYTSSFCILFLVASWMNAISAPLWIAVYATGKIKKYQIAVSLVFFSDIIIVWALFHYFNVPPTASMVAKAFINVVVVFVRLYFASILSDSFSAKTYFTSVIVRCALCSIVILVPTALIFTYTDGVMVQLCLSVVVTLLACLFTYAIGFDNDERLAVKRLITKIRG